MARKPRIEYEGAFYHVITRGNQKQKIFKDPSDNQKFLEILASYKQRFHFQLYAYVLMSNHIHFIIETKDTPLSKIFQGVNQRYTMYYNRKYKTVGHLFQGRYKAILCDRDRYLVALLKYIHYNPVRANMPEGLNKYPWSSYQAYLTKTERADLIDTDLVLRMFSENKGKARKHYAEFMNDGATVKKEDIYSTIDQRLLGDERFVEKVAEKHEGDIKKERRKKEYSLPQLARALERQYDVSLEEMRSWGRTFNILTARRLFSILAKEYGYKGREIAVYLRKDPAAVTGYLRSGEEVRKGVAAVVAALKKE
jgi:REP element-mobilizing transposase RayT